MAVCAIKAVELPVKRRAALPYSERWLANPAAAVAEMPRNAPLTFTVATPDAGIFTLARSCSLPSAMKRCGDIHARKVMLTSVRHEKDRRHHDGSRHQPVLQLDGRGEPRVRAPQATVDRPASRRGLTTLGHS